jgi:hypothetical protein|tara:strand:- start:619 stop:912 length:294 start_codon:yes stop_codon:yes gene_type:complete
MAAKRDYKAEYKKFHSSPAAKKKRADTNKRRAEIQQRRLASGKPRLRTDQHVKHKTRNGKTTTSIGSARSNQSSSTDTPGDRTRKKGCKKNQPKKKR